MKLDHAALCTRCGGHSDECQVTIAHHGTGIAVRGLTTGSGNAGQFTINKTGSPAAAVLASAAASVLIIFMHRTNVLRVWMGTERRVGARA